MTPNKLVGLFIALIVIFALVSAHQGQQPGQGLHHDPHKRGQRTGYHEYTEYKSKTHPTRSEPSGDNSTAELFGLALALLAAFALHFNERRHAQRSRALAEAMMNVHEIHSGPMGAQLEPGLEGKLVRLQGHVLPLAEVVDKAFGVSLPVIKLARKVETFQWIETRTTATSTAADGTTLEKTDYSYRTDWAKDLIDSSTFKLGADHQNPSIISFRSETFVCPGVSIAGSYRLNTAQIDAVEADNILQLNEGMRNVVPQELFGRVAVADDYLYVGNPVYPRIGDIRIRFYKSAEGAYTVLAKQFGSTFAPWAGSNGQTIDIIRPGVHTAQELVAAEQSSNSATGWLVRVFGGLFILLGAWLLSDTILATSFEMGLGWAVILFGDGLFIVAFAAALTFAVVFVSKAAAKKLA